MALGHKHRHLRIGLLALVFEHKVAAALVVAAGRDCAADAHEAPLVALPRGAGDGEGDGAGDTTIRLHNRVRENPKLGQSRLLPQHPAHPQAISPLHRGAVRQKQV